MKSFIGIACVLTACFAAGCGGDPPLYPISGKVTLGGKSYERLIVYFRPIDAAPTQFNIGVGETDAQGNLSLRSSAGMGMESGKYRVTFSCYVTKTGEALGVDQKSDELSGGETATPKEMVPAPYLEGSAQESPVVFEVVAGQQSNFEFDIPAS